jgi:hypothetical protein
VGYGKTEKKMERPGTPCALKEQVFKTYTLFMFIMMMKNFQ